MEQTGSGQIMEIRRKNPALICIMDTMKYVSDTVFLGVIRLSVSAHLYLVSIINRQDSIL